MELQIIMPTIFYFEPIEDTALRISFRTVNLSAMAKAVLQVATCTIGTAIAFVVLNSS